MADNKVVDNRLKYGLNGHLGNNMTTLLNRIERQLGLSVIPLPDGLKKRDWARIISEDTIPVFSEYFPYQIRTIVQPEQCVSKDGWLFIDNLVPEGTRILGVKDVDWEEYRADPRFSEWGIYVSNIDYMTSYSLDDYGLAAVGADMLSLFNLGVYIEFQYPNKIRLVSCNGHAINQKRPFPLLIFIEHPNTLHTISPTMMETFTNLAKADVATAIYQVLKYYDELDSTYASVQLKLDTLQDWANRRDDIIRQLDEAHTSTANEYQPAILTV